MTFEDRLKNLGERYKSQGYNVVMRPGPGDLPPFAKDFKVELLATRADGSVLASAKRDRRELDADGEISRYAGIIEKEPGWRFDLIVLGPDRVAPTGKTGVREMSDEEIYKAIDEVGRMTSLNLKGQALIAAWAVSEAVMRRRLRALGEKAEWGSSPRTMLNELFSAGEFTDSAFREIEGVLHLRNMAVHGFPTPVIGENVVPFLIDASKKLLRESVPDAATV